MSTPEPPASSSVSSVTLTCPCTSRLAVRVGRGRRVAVVTGASVSFGNSAGPPRFGHDEVAGRPSSSVSPIRYARTSLSPGVEFGGRVIDLSTLLRLASATEACLWKM